MYKFLLGIILFLPLAIVNAADANESESATIYQKSYTLSDLGQNGSIALQGGESEISFSFGSRLDEIVLGLSLDFTYTPSPSLISHASHLKVYLNEDLMSVLPIKENNMGKKVTEKILLDPRFLRDSNQVRIQLVGRDDAYCYNPDSVSIWAEVSSTTALNFKIKKTQLNSDLALLPAPFFNASDYMDVNLFFIIPNDFDLPSLKAVGVAASYFGSLAKWRDVDLNISTDKLPEQHAIAFATNDHKPDFIKNMPNVEKPTIQIISNPIYSDLKILLILGKDAEDLNTAVQALSLGNSLMTGNIAFVNDVQNNTLRKPYDSPNWIDTTRAISFSELVDSQYQLQTKGFRPNPISIEFNLPPDLFTWDSKGVPMDLAYRYSPPLSDHSGARLSVSINNQFIKGFSLSKAGENTNDKWLQLPLLDKAFPSSASEMSLPAFRVGSKNNIGFEFGFASSTSGECETFNVSNNFAAIDPDSSIDFSDLPHYIKMPNMAAFASSGFPYTRLADLSETAIFIKSNPTWSETKLFFDVMTFLGRKSGLSGSQVTVTEQWNDDALKDKDVIVIGTQKTLQGFNNSEQAKLAYQNMNRLLQRPDQSEKAKGNIWQQKAYGDTSVSDFINIESSGPFASMVSFESPFSKGRTIVTLSAQQDEYLTLISDTLKNEGQQPFIFGSVTAIRNGKLNSFDVGDSYYVGSLPIYKLVWFHFSEHPVLLALFVIFIVILLTIFLWKMLQTIATRRLNGEQ
jgi:hypothetical protein